MINTQKQTSKPVVLRGLVHVRQASRLLKIDEFNVYAAIWRGALRAKKYKGKWQIPLSAIERYEIRARSRERLQR